ncbi:DUF2514 family protein [Burkholderia sp. AU45274]|uniref:DUF2514 family protein n=1 Tax=Burkholderia sp. AU45274 TaxID=3059205 RepID=UPI00264D3461|nr:DUF2514 family protein [Burkholderia sp. AU45274]MDN7489519.1 DUF2514 family protein [Burkholderia sp. AU45274]
MTILDPRLWLAFIAALAITAGTCYFAGHKAGVRETTAAAQKAQLAAVDAARAEEQRRTAAQSEIAKDANKQRTAALADAFAARAAAGSLQQRVDRLVAAGRHPTATAGSPATGDALDLLADVLGRADERAGELAEYADRARIAGQQCERSYDALTVLAK